MLADVRRFRVSSEAVANTEAALRSAGRAGHELFVLWSGKRDGFTFEVRTTHVPKQTSYRLDGGLSVRVEGAELHRLNVWLYEAGEVLGVQVHAHPTDAFHSETDNAFPIVATIGGLSIVAADFCRRGLLSKETAIFRLTESGWTKERRDIVEVTK